MVFNPFTGPAGYSILQTNDPNKLQIIAGNNKLVLQGDGNLVLTSTTSNKILWASKSNVPNYTGSTFFLDLQTDGNLIITQRNALGNNSVIWSSNIYTTCSHTQQPIFVMQSDGNLVELFPKTLDANNQVTQYYAIGDSGSCCQVVSNHWGTFK